MWFTGRYVTVHLIKSTYCLPALANKKIELIEDLSIKKSTHLRNCNFFSAISNSDFSSPPPLSSSSFVIIFVVTPICFEEKRWKHLLYSHQFHRDELTCFSLTWIHWNKYFFKHFHQIILAWNSFTHLRYHFVRAKRKNCTS